MWYNKSNKGLLFSRPYRPEREENPMDIEALIGSINALKEKLSKDDVDYIYCILMEIVTNPGSS